jgi:hypothetical protein
LGDAPSSIHGAHSPACAQPRVKIAHIGAKKRIIAPKDARL